MPGAASGAARRRHALYSQYPVCIATDAADAADATDALRPSTTSTTSTDPIDEKL